MAGSAGAVLSGRDRLVVLAGVALLGVLGVGVLVSSAGPTADQGGAVATPGAGTLVEGVVGRATSINPLEPQNAADLDLIELVFSGLTRSFPDGSVGPDLAESWTISADRTVYTFTLRPGATWQDGVPVTADDVVFTVLTIQDPDYTGPLRTSWGSVRVEKVDQRTVRFTLAEPVGAFLQATTLPILPAHLLVGVPVAQLANDPFNRQPVGSGPYRLVRLDFDQAELQLARPASPGASASPSPAPPGGVGEPIGRIVVRFFPDGASLATAYRSGLVDSAAGLLPQQVRDLANEPGTRVVRYPSTRLTVLVPNVRAGHPFFLNAAVRRGLLEGLDREAMIANLLDGAGQRADSPISPESWAYDADSTTVYQHDDATAVKDLKAGGWSRGTGGWTTKSGQQVTFGLSAIDARDDPLGNSIARTAVQDWNTLGVTSDVVSFDTDGFVAQLVKGNFDMALLNVNMGLDPDVFPLLTSSQALEGGSNVGGYQSAALDKLLAAARLGADRQARIQAFGDLQQILTRDLPLLPIVFADDLYVVRDRLSGPSPRLVSDRSERLWDVLTWRLAGEGAAASP